MKKGIAIVAAVIIALAAVYVVGSGFLKIPSAYISDFTVSDDGSEMTVHVGVGSSVGFVRKVAVHQQEGGKLYLDCCAAFGGVNGSLGAKSEYTVKLNEDTEMIALYRSTDCYEEVLRKDENGDWQRVQ